MNVRAILSMALFAAGSTSALAALVDSALVPILIAVLVIVGAAVEWWTLRRRGPDAAEIADHMLLWVGLALIVS